MVYACVFGQCTSAVLRPVVLELVAGVKSKTYNVRW